MLKIVKKMFFKDEYREIDLLKRKIARLQDENQSLWDMLDEIKASDTKNHNMSKEIDTIVERAKNRITKSVDIVKAVSKAGKKEIH